MPNSLWPTALLVAISACGLLAGCEVGNPDTVSPVTSSSYSGYYVNPSGGPMVSGNTGSAVTSLTVTQSGDELQAVDNNGILFKGSVTIASSNQPAIFILDGTTTAGAKVTINGTLQGSGSSAVMTGQWIEPTVVLGFTGKNSS